MEKFNYIIQYLMATEGYQGHSSKGERVSICIPMDSVKTISQLSYILGKMDMSKVHGDEDNFKSLELLFDNICMEHGIDMADFDEWMADNAE